MSKFQLAKYVFFSFKNMTNLPSCKKHYVVGRIFDDQGSIPP
jgi:hypothetical protein